ncbi:MAG: hypothetical protein ACR2IP_03550, partial [Solirubrobacteraceae bacterium]
RSPAPVSMRRQARPSKTRIPAGAAGAAQPATLQGMSTITEDFSQLEAQFGPEAVKEFAVGAYSEVFGSPLVKAAPEDLAALSAKLDSLITIVGKLVNSEASEDDDAPIAKSNGHSRLSGRDKAAVRALTSGF